ncbi:tRNA pseudouridine(38-40) synthase TruA [Oscillochloris sp. ZM17-4]|uniref:tRNA pseudouridine(38-40) synthase TruA n=1 Tax=Oscillochloris sp. ZM17-4 TaxID=2866714 RepID=UPI001C72C099|nr:tRNA pseudouridine(38-40) synthase TruA [Oscillochloris sp. ZM17-4]
MRNVALRLAYDGTDFVGSQYQNQGRTVQGALEQAWEELTQERQRITLAGRTDAGVHAAGQVANIRTATKHSRKTILRGMNAKLPADVAIQAVCDVGMDFHARHSAHRRAYRFLIDNNVSWLPTQRNYVLYVEQKLDVAAMAEAVMRLEGTHDFAAFSALVPDQRSTVRTCYTARLSEVETFGRRLIAIDLAANAFLQHMVRVIVGTVVLAGRGKITPDGFQRILEGRDRKAAGPTAPAHGLTLVSVGYPTGLVRWDDEDVENAIGR